MALINVVINSLDKLSSYLKRKLPHENTSLTNPDLELYKKYYSLRSIKHRRFYNIGAGSFRHPNWTNIDLASDWYSEVQDDSNMINYDLFSIKPLPIHSSSAEVVYTSHTVEHINDKASQNMFNESFRILKKGGVFRMTTPDIDLYYRAFINNDKDFFWWIDLYSRKDVTSKLKIKPFNKFSLAQIFLFSFATHTTSIVLDKSCDKISDTELRRVFKTKTYNDALNYCISKCKIESQNKFPGYHMNWWNWEKGLYMLKKAGFKDIFKSGYGQSTSPIMRNTLLFDKQDPKDSLYIEAIK